LLVALSLALAGCGGSGDGGAEAPKVVPSCARQTETIPRPEALPSDLPVPSGTVFTKVERPFRGQAIVSGVSPGNLESTRGFYDDELKDAGYRQGRPEAEPGETEALFTGKGVRGGWRANTMPNCDGAVRLTLVVVQI
jgi:hypothetical protein